MSMQFEDTALVLVVGVLFCQLMDFQNNKLADLGFICTIWLVWHRAAGWQLTHGLYPNPYNVRYLNDVGYNDVVTQTKM